MNQGRTPTNDDRGKESIDNGPTETELQDAYDTNEGNIAATAREFNISPTWCRTLLIRHDIHENSGPHLADRLLENVDADETGGETAL